MAIFVNTNVSSLNAQRNLATNSASQTKTLQRLSSGLRINSASDDAAGMAIGSGLTSMVRGMNQAIRNSNDGLSLLSTAEGAVVEQTNLLQRMRELAVQSASDTNSNSNRASLNSEVSQLKSEFERIARTVQFNGINLLDGTFQSKDLQVGAYANANERISVSIGSTRSADVGSAYKVTSGAVTSNTLDSGDVTLTVNGTTHTVGAAASDGVSSTGATVSALAKANAINAISHNTGVTAEATNSVTAANAQAAATINAGEFTINGVDIGAVTTTSASSQELVTAINAKFAQTGVTAALNTSNKLVLTAADGRNITTVVGATTTADDATGIAEGTATTYGTITLRSVDAFTVGGTTVADAGLSAGAATLATAENVNTLDLSSKSNAQLAIKIVDVALSQLNSRRADVGALTNRLTTTISNLSSAAENASASNSRIQDADFATETANMSRTQILQQAGVAILSQANQGPQLALSLLR